MVKKKRSYSKGGTKADKKKARIAAAAQKKKKQKKSTTDAPSSNKKPSPTPPLKQPPTTTTRRQSNDSAPIIKDDDGSLALAAEIVKKLPTDLWWRSLQDPDGEVDIAIGSRQEWSLIIPVLLKSGLYKPPGVGVAGKYKLQFVKERWDELKQLLLEEKHNMFMEWVPLELQGCSISYHIRIRGDDAKNAKTMTPLRQMKNVVQSGIMNVMSSLKSARRNTRKKRAQDNALKDSDDELREILVAFRTKFENEFILFATKEMEKDKDMIATIQQYSDELVAASEERRKQLLSNNKTTGEETNESSEGETNTMADAVKEQVDTALALNFEARPRLARLGGKEIAIHKRKQTDELMAVALAKCWGHDNPSLTYRERKRLEDAVCRQIAYDHGFPKPSGGSMLGKWSATLNSGVTGGDTAPLKSNHKGSKSMTSQIEEENQGYLHELYRYAISMVGIKATFKEIAEMMNEKSAAPNELRPELHLHYKQVYEWWKEQGGTEKSAFEKPRLTDEHKKQRAQWVIDNVRFLEDDFPVCYLDEKWFYTVTRRRKIKILPHATHEPIGADFVKRPKTRSRRFPIKIMYLGVVGRPRTVGDTHFNGRIMLERISKTSQVVKKTKHQRFTTDAVANYELKNGRWKDLYVNGMTVGEMGELIVDSYDLDEEVADRLEFHYENWTQGRKKTKKNTPLDTAELLVDEARKTRRENGDSVPVLLDDLHLGVRYKEGDEVQHDINCDSAYMLSIMPKVGKAIRDAYSWVDKDDFVYLVLDSAGGHGTKEAIQEYRQLLLEQYKIKLVHQVPQSPDTNVLDLGIWMSLQSAVEKRHRMHRGDKEALNESVMGVWEEVTNEEAFVKVFDRLKKNYKIIEKNGGGNDLVEEFRGKKGMEDISAYEFVGADMEVDLEDEEEGIPAVVGLDDAINLEVDVGGEESAA